MTECEACQRWQGSGRGQNAAVVRSGTAMPCETRKTAAPAPLPAFALHTTDLDPTTTHKRVACPGEPPVPAIFHSYQRLLRRIRGPCTSRPSCAQGRPGAPRILAQLLVRMPPLLATQHAAGPNGPAKAIHRMPHLSATRWHGQAGEKIIWQGCGPYEPPHKGVGFSWGGDGLRLPKACFAQQNQPVLGLSVV